MVFKKRSIQYEENLCYGASENIIEKANQLRKRQTETEKKLWPYLRNRRLNGYKFRKQHPIWIFIADFYCHEAKLVIELDGEIHNKIDTKEHDINRSVEIEKFEIKVLRFKNAEIEQNLENVLQIIKSECEQRTKMNK